MVELWDLPFHRESQESEHCPGNSDTSVEEGAPQIRLSIQPRRETY